MSVEYFSIGLVLGAVAVFAIVILLSPGGLIDKQAIGTFICNSHNLGEYKEIVITEGEVLWVSCAKELKQENEVKIRVGGIQK